MKPDLTELDAFAAVARHGSFRKAADERGVSASALSHAMRTLEQRLGVRLLNRTTRSVTATEAGQQLLSTLQPALAAVASALQALQCQQQVPTGTLRLNVSRPAARLVVGPMLGPFMAAYPRIKVELLTDDGLTDIVAKGFDAGVRFGESLASDMIALPIGAPQAFVCVAAPGYLRARGTPQAPRELLEHACIGRRFPSGKLYSWEFLLNGQPLRLAVPAALVLEDDGLMLQAALDGAGIAYVYEAMAKPYLADGRLQELLQDCKAAASRFFIYYPSRRHTPPALQALIDFSRARG
ncbi:LysR substrate-binding domain-containing protein [Pseudomonas sp. NPDC007930]|uniref:LysR family transcriptional regulator n=1 Tax=Pseudomonas sp. NPDC007930 TaxID=3364417 RepID=UPI0036E38C20